MNILRPRGDFSSVQLPAWRAEQGVRWLRPGAQNVAVSRRLLELKTELGRIVPETLPRDRAEFAALVAALVPTVVKVHDALYGILASSPTKQPTVMCLRLSEAMAFQVQDYRAALQKAGLADTWLDACVERYREQCGNQPLPPCFYSRSTRQVVVCPDLLWVEGANGEELADALLEEIVHVHQDQRGVFADRFRELATLVLTLPLERDGLLPPSSAPLSPDRVQDVSATFDALRDWIEGEPTFVRARARDAGFFSTGRFEEFHGVSSAHLEAIYDGRITLGTDDRDVWSRLVGQAAVRLVEREGRTADFLRQPWKIAALGQQSGTLWLEVKDPPAARTQILEQLGEIWALRRQLVEKLQLCRPMPPTVPVRLVASGAGVRGCLDATPNPRPRD